VAVIDHLIPIAVVLGLTFIAWRFERGSKGRNR